MYGRIRQTDFIPVGATEDTARILRGRLSESEEEGDSQDEDDDGQESDVFSHGSVYRDEYDAVSEDDDCDRTVDICAGYEGVEDDSLAPLLALL